VYTAQRTGCGLSFAIAPLPIAALRQVEEQ
jgi:hypothetical protein